MMAEKRCLAMTARDRQCKKHVFKDGLCDSHFRKNARDMEAGEGSIKIAESDNEVVVKAKVKIEAKGDTRVAARKRRDERFAERDKNGMLPNQKLGMPPRAGYVRRWVNDDPGRVDEVLDKGYSFVVDDDEAIRSTDQGTRKSQVVGRQTDGSALTGYAMEQEETLYSEDQQAKSEIRDRKEEEIRRVSDKSGIGGSAYDPQEGKGQFRVEN